MTTSPRTYTTLRDSIEKRSYQARMDKAQHMGRPRVYLICKHALADAAPGVKIEFSLKEHLLNIFCPEDDDD